MSLEEDQDGQAGGGEGAEEEDAHADPSWKIHANYLKIS